MAPALGSPLIDAETAYTIGQATSAAGRQRINDQLAWITAEDFALAATRRNAEVLRMALQSGAASGGRLPFAASTPGGECVPRLYSGFLPTSCPFNDGTSALTFALPANAVLDGWPQFAFYAVAPGCSFGSTSATCSTANSPLATPTIAQASAVLLLRGRRFNGCPIATAESSMTDMMGCIENGTSRNSLVTAPLDASQLRPFAAPANWPASNNFLKQLP
jgi:hypothetical protein